jgi:hypothetical protein
VSTAPTGPPVSTAPPPYGPTTAEVILPGPGVRFHAGGTPAAARADAWTRSIRFLAEHLTR